jgi:hypothetical protein
MPRIRNKAQNANDSISANAREAIKRANKRGVDFDAALEMLASCMTTMHDGYEKTVVSPTGELLTVIERDLKGASSACQAYIKILAELGEQGGNEPDEDDDGRVEFIQIPLIVPIDSRVARLIREGQEIDYIEETNGTKEGEKVRAVVTPAPMPVVLTDDPEKLKLRGYNQP